ncbi:hypothetical protein C0995_013563 [Termitomyces sp. Mi166|nr:hypothetical protein C0995_013563 [Termitomyces sp. Mi166\
MDANSESNSETSGGPGSRHSSRTPREQGMTPSQEPGQPCNVVRAFNASVKYTSADYMKAREANAKHNLKIKIANKVKTEEKLEVIASEQEVRINQGDIDHEEQTDDEDDNRERSSPETDSEASSYPMHQDSDGLGYGDNGAAETEKASNEVRGELEVLRIRENAWTKERDEMKLTIEAVRSVAERKQKELEEMKIFAEEAEDLRKIKEVEKVEDTKQKMKEAEKPGKDMKKRRK